MEPDWVPCPRPDPRAIFLEVIGVPECRLMHIADVHLGYPFPGMPNSLARLRQDELKQAFARALAEAAARDVRALVIAGDLFHQETVDRETVRFAAERLGELRGVQVLIAPGQADPLTGYSVYRVQVWPDNVHIFGPAWEQVDLPGQGVTFWGRGTSSAPWQPPTQPVADPERLNIRVAAGDLDGAAGTGFQPLSGRELLRLGFDYFALGGRHQAMPLETAGRVRGAYPGSPEPLDLAETGQHGAMVVKLAKVDSRVDFVALGRREQLAREVDCTGAQNIQDVLAQMLRVDDPVSRRQNCYRLTLTGVVDPGLTIAVQPLRERLAGEFFWLDIVDRTVPDLDLSRLGQEKTARGLFVQAMQQRLAAEHNPALRQRLYRVLRVGLAALEGRGVARP
jgi:exonuclease SbcD